MDAATLVREMRQRHRINQRSLATRCRTSQTYISRVERGEISPSVDTLAKLLEGVGERLVLRAMAAPVGNRSAADLERDLALSPGERIAQAAELSFALTSLAGANRKRA